MCNPVALGVVGTGFQAIGAYQQSSANKRAYDKQAQVGERNAKIAEWQAQDAVDRGKTEALKYSKQVDQLQGTQRAALASNNVRLDEGSPLAILTDTSIMGESDVRTIRANAEREAYGYRVNAQNYRDNAALYTDAARSENPLLAGTSSLLAGAGSVSSKWYNYKKTGLY